MRFARLPRGSRVTPRVVLQALSDARPKRRYMIVAEQAQAERTIRGVVGVLMQLNDDQAYTCDRATLNRMMDDAATKTRSW